MKKSASKKNKGNLQGADICQRPEWINPQGTWKLKWKGMVDYNEKKKPQNECVLFACIASYPVFCVMAVDRSIQNFIHPMEWLFTGL